MKRFCFFVLASLLAVSKAHAQAYYEHQNCCDQTIPVYVPTFCGGFEFDITYLSLKPTVSNLDYAVANNALPEPALNWDVKTLRPSYHSAVEVAGAYVIPDSGNDFRLSWTRLHGGDHDSVAVVPFAPAGVVPLFNSGVSSGLLGTTPFVDAHARVTHNFDCVNFTAGQAIDIGCALRMRLFAGASYVRIRQSFSQTFITNGETTVFNKFQWSEFPSGGPIFGFNSFLDLGYGFGVVGEFSGSVLVGKRTRHVSFRTTSATHTPPTNGQSIQQDSRTDTITGFDGKFGLCYSWDFCNGSMLNIEAGWRAAVYNDAIELVVPQDATIVAASDGVDSPLFTEVVDVTRFRPQTSDFGFNGPYVAFNFNF